jgi:hypothetical protein
MKIKIVVPNSLGEITLGQYQEYLKETKEQDKSSYLQTKMIEIFCNMKIENIIKMKAKDINSIVQIITDIFDQKPSLIKRFKLNGIEYGFVPNLDEISFGEYVDLDTYIGDWDYMERAMAVLYRPIKQKHKLKYSIEEYKAENQEVMKDMPLDAVFSSILFFYHLGIDLSKAMTNYLEETQQAHLVQYLSSQPNGVGFNQFTHSLKEMLEGLKISLS